MPNAARQIWPHLQSGERPERQQRGQSLAATLWPSQTPEAKTQEAARKRDRDRLLRNLRELNARMRER